MSDRFYTRQPLGPGEFLLDGPEAHHLSAVRRFGPGDRVTLFNGDGFDYPAEVVAVGKKTVALAVREPVAAGREVGFPLVVASAVPKGDRADYLIEKLTEVGVTRYVPLLTSRSVVRPKAEKFARAVIEASKQCGRNVLMAVDPPTRWEEFVCRVDLPTAKVILHTEGGSPVRGVLPDAVRSGVVVAVGPEGGFDADEVKAAAANGWRAITLGRRSLRVETAAAVAAAYLAVIGER